MVMVARLLLTAELPPPATVLKVTVGGRLLMPGRFDLSTVAFQLV
jgi:hypothetical protein